MSGRIQCGPKHRADDYAAVRTAILAKYPDKTAQELADLIGLDVRMFKRFLADQAGHPTFVKVRSWWESQIHK